jgi:hypothetical protein
MTGKLLFISIASLFSWAALALGADYEKKTPLTIITQSVTPSEYRSERMSTPTPANVPQAADDVASQPEN